MQGPGGFVRVTSPGVALLVALSGFLAALFVGYLLLVEGAADRPIPAVLKGLFGVALPMALLGGARWLHESDLDPPTVWRVTMWSLGGLGALTLLTAWRFYVDALGGGAGPTAFETLLLNGQAGAVGGLLVGVYDARARRNARRAADARDQYRLLNQLLRHNILNSVQLIQTTVGTHRELEDTSVLDDVERHCEAISELVRKARTLEQATVDGDDLEPVDLAAVVADQVDVYRSAYPAATFEADLPDDCQVVAGPFVDAVVENLLSNAVEHNDREHPTVRVELDADPTAATLVVADDGPGLSDRMKETVFELDRSGTPRGLGLYLVDTLVDHYGGSVEILDAEPRGTRVIVEFERPDEAGGDRE